MSRRDWGRTQSVMFVMVSVTVVMRVGDNNQEDGRTTLECEQTQSKLQVTEGIKGLKMKGN